MKNLILNCIILKLCYKIILSKLEVQILLEERLWLKDFLNLLVVMFKSLFSISISMNFFFEISKIFLEKHKNKISNFKKRNPLIVSSKPGYGKSSLLGRFASSYATSPLSQSHNILSHFVGVTKNSTDLRSLFWRFCHELYRKFPIAQDYTVPEDFESLINLFPELLRKGIFFFLKKQY